jgi:hypothetical protein
MSRTNLRGDFYGSPAIKDDRTNRSPLGLDSHSELKVPRDERLETLVEGMKALYKSRLQESSFNKALTERKVDIHNLIVYRMPFHVDMGSDLAEYLSSVIMKNVKLDSYENTLFVFQNKEKSLLVEAWPGNNFSTMAVYHEIAKPGHFKYPRQLLPSMMEGFRAIGYSIIREDWIKSELERIIRSALYHYDDDLDFSL